MSDAPFNPADIAAAFARADAARDAGASWEEVLDLDAKAEAAALAHVRELVAAAVERDALKAMLPEIMHSERGVRNPSWWAAAVVEHRKRRKAEMALEKIASLTAGELSLGDQVFAVTSARACLAAIRNPTTGDSI